MKPKATLVDFADKDKAQVELAKRSTPQERIELLFELIELSQHFRPKPSAAINKPDDLPFIVLKKRTDAV
ncbi:MAG: hypothetical protein ACOYXT_25760 [Bacteroidota bacterium]